MKDTIFQQIKAEKDIVETEQIEANPPYAPTHTSLIDLIYSYLNSKYRDGNFDADGFQKPFYNISEFRCRVASKSIDLDTKDIRIIPTDGFPSGYAWITQKRLAQYMKEKKWGKLLNDIKNELPRWGTVWVKKVRDNVFIVNPRNIYPDPYLTNRFLNEIHYYSPDQYEEEASKRGWKTGEVIDLYSKKEGKGKVPTIEVWERYGGWGKNFSLTRHIVTGLDLESSGGILLSEENIDKSPYKKLNYIDKVDRTQGEGIIETLLEAQIAINESKYYSRKGMHWTSKHIYQTRDPEFTGNVLTDVTDGEVLRVRSEVTPVAMEERNLAHYNAENRDWEQAADRQSFTYDIVRGERLPAGTPLGSAKIQTAQTASYFEGIRENFGLFLKDIIYDWVLPDFKKENHKEHTFRLLNSDKDIEKFDNLVVEAKARKEVFNRIIKDKKLPSAEELKVVKMVEKERIKSDRKLNVPVGLYDGKFGIEIVITGESVDIQAEQQTRMMLLQIIGANPQIIRDPVARGILGRIAELSGVSLEDLGLNDQQSLSEGAEQMSAQRGGSIARPTPTSGAVPSQQAL